MLRKKIKPDENGSGPQGGGTKTKLPEAPDMQALLEALDQEIREEEAERLTLLGNRGCVC